METKKMIDVRKVVLESLCVFCVLTFLSHSRYAFSVKMLRQCLSVRPAITTVVSCDKTVAWTSGHDVLTSEKTCFISLMGPNITFPIGRCNLCQSGQDLQPEKAFRKQFQSQSLNGCSQWENSNSTD